MLQNLIIESRDSAAGDYYADFNCYINYLTNLVSSMNSMSPNVYTTYTYCCYYRGSSCVTFSICIHGKFEKFLLSIMFLQYGKPSHMN